MNRLVRVRSDYALTLITEICFNPFYEHYE